MLRIQRGNHRSCQSPIRKSSYITLCLVFKEATTEAVSRQDTTAVILHVLLTLVVLSAPVRVDVFFETCKKECYNKGRPEISDGFGGGLGLVWYLSQDPVSQDPGSYLPGSSLAGSSLPGSSLPGSSLPGSSLPGSSLPGSSPSGRGGETPGEGGKHQGRGGETPAPGLFMLISSKWLPQDARTPPL